MIKSIILNNFQAHEYLKLDFSKDLNIITGLSDAGKSCVRRAIGWICFNENISETDYRKEGTSETSVSLILENDFTIERIRTNILNRYITSIILRLGNWNKLQRITIEFFCILLIQLLINSLLTRLSWPG